MAVAPSNTSIAAPIALSIWITPGEDESAGSTVFSFRISGSPSTASPLSQRASEDLQVEPQVVGVEERWRNSSVKKCISSFGGLRGVPQDQPSVGPCGWPDVRPCDQRRSAGRSPPRYGAPLPANQPAMRGSGAAPRLSELETEAVAVSPSTAGDPASPSGEQRRVEVAVARRAPLQSGVGGPFRPASGRRRGAWAPGSAGSPDQGPRQPDHCKQPAPRGCRRRVRKLFMKSNGSRTPYAARACRT